jgi:hypothetical protein
MSSFTVQKVQSTLTVQKGAPAILRVATKTINTVTVKATGTRGSKGEPGESIRGDVGPMGPVGPRGESADLTAVSTLANRVDALTSTVTDIRSLAPEALNAFSEVASALNNDPQFAQTMTTALGNRVRFDAVQALTATQRNVARSNLDAASVSDVTGKLAKENYVRSLQVVIGGKPPANSLLGGGITPQNGTIDATASRFLADTAPSAETVFTLKVNGAQRGTITFPAGQTVGVLVLTGTTLVAGDRIAFYSGATDATLGGVIGSLVVRL